MIGALVSVTCLCGHCRCQLFLTLRRASQKHGRGYVGRLPGTVTCKCGQCGATNEIAVSDTADGVNAVSTRVYQ